MTPTPTADTPPDAPGPRARRSGLVLVVDDDRDAREMYADYLHHCGFATHTADDGTAAVELALRLTPDAIVMDLSMPTLDGIAATQRIRRNPRTRHVPVILVTGYPQQAIERDAIKAGVDVFLTKPCLPEDVEATVRQLVESKRRRLQT